MRYTGGFDLAGLTARMEAAVPAGLEDAMLHIEAVSVAEVPLEYGHLIGSRQSGVDGEGRGYLSYGTPYARYQEYGVSSSGRPLRHEHGKSHFLADPMREEAGEALRIVANKVGDAL